MQPVDLADEQIAALMDNVMRSMFAVEARLATDAPAAEMQCHTAVRVKASPDAPGFTLSLSTNFEGASALSAVMFACSASSIDEDMRRDTLGELANMSAGQLKSLLAPGSMLGIPESVSFDPASLTSVRVVQVIAGDIPLIVRIAAEHHPLSSQLEPR